MKKILISVTCISAIALSLFSVSCAKKEVVQPNAVVTTAKSNQSSTTTNALRMAIPVKPDSLPDPNQFVSFGPAFCLNVNYSFYLSGYEAYPSGGDCSDDWGFICGWHCYGCGDNGPAIAIQQILLPSIGKVTTGIIYVKFQYNGKLNKAGKPMIAPDNILMGDDFNKIVNCDAAYLLKGEYTIQKGNIATMAVYVVNHKI